MGRPPTVPRKLKDAFYIEVCSHGSKNGVKISCNSSADMIKAKDLYQRNKYVIVLGEHKNGKWLTEKILPSASKNPRGTR